MTVANIKSLAELEALRSDETGVVLNFAAEWCEPCAQMNDVFGTLAKRHAALRFVTVDVDAVRDDDALLERYSVTAVPTYVLLAPDLTLRARVDGADAARLTATLEQHAAAAGANAVDAMAARLDALTTRAPVVLFMKGSPDAPECGFSNRMVALLRRHADVPFDHFNILSDEGVRQALKAYANWPTYPQLWADGKLVGGLDIVQEMDEDDELLPVLRAALDKASQSTRERIDALLASAPLVLFMKGTRSEPRCKFSRAMIELLDAQKVDEFATFDILSDPAVRSEIKTYKNFPTFPQLYAHGKLVGGLDVIKELAEEGELQAQLQKSD